MLVVSDFCGVFWKFKNPKSLKNGYECQTLVSDVILFPRLSIYLFLFIFEFIYEYLFEGGDKLSVYLGLPSTHLSDVSMQDM